MAPDAVTLGEYVSLQRGTTYKSRLLGQPGPVLLGLATIERNGGFRRDSLKTYGGDTPEKLVVHPGDLYVSLKDVTQAGDLLGAVARLPEDHPPGRLTQDTVRLVPNRPDTPLDYIYWLLRTPQVREYCRAHATGTTNLGLPRDDFLGILVPHLTTARRQIVTILNQLEAKIDLNQRMTQTLEGIARAVFKSWFVDFDPVRAKAEGGSSGPPKHLADHFPCRLVDSEVGEIPEGWQTKALDEIAEYVNGAACQKYPPEPGSPTLPVIKIRELSQGVSDQSDRVHFDVPSKHRADDGEVLFSWSGTLVCKVWTGGPGFVNQHVFKVSSEEYPQWFVLYWTKHHLDAFRDIAADKATTMGHIKREHLSEALVVAPPPDLMAAVNDVFAPLVDRQVAADLESRSLGAIRDLLLPRLVSGEVRTADPQALVESAV